jgi:hypothetical protein
MYIARIIGRALAALIVLGVILALSQSHSSAGVEPRHSLAARVQP